MFLFYCGCENQHTLLGWWRETLASVWHRSVDVKLSHFINKTVCHSIGPATQPALRLMGSLCANCLARWMEMDGVCVCVCRHKHTHTPIHTQPVRNKYPLKLHPLQIHADNGRAEARQERRETPCNTPPFRWAPGTLGRRCENWLNNIANPVATLPLAPGATNQPIGNP